MFWLHLISTICVALVTVALVLWVLVNIGVITGRRRRISKGIDLANRLNLANRNNEALLVLSMIDVLYMRPGTRAAMDDLRLSVERARLRQISLDNILVEFCETIAQTSPEKLPEDIREIVWPYSL